MLTDAVPRPKLTSVADSHHFDADPDRAFLLDANPDHTFYADADLDLDPDPTVQVDADLDSTTHFFPYLDPPVLRNNPLRLPPFHFDADPDPQNCLESAYKNLNTSLMMQVCRLTKIELYE
jgi:hypothetical protein